MPRLRPSSIVALGLLPLLAAAHVPAFAQLRAVPTQPGAAQPGTPQLRALPPQPGSAPVPPAASSGPPAREVLLDRVVAVVNDEAITQFEVDEGRRAALVQLRERRIDPPAPDVLERQVLERLVTERAMMQFAKETGVRVDDTVVERAMARIAQENKLAPDQLRAAVEREGIPFAKYREDIRRELTLQRVRDREVEARVNVTDAEVDNLLATMVAQGGRDREYLLQHILVGVPEQSSPEQIAERRRRAEEALRQVQDGGDFTQVAASLSDAPDALQGASLGWRNAARLPTIFADVVRGMKPGEVSGILRGPAGFHIVKLVEQREQGGPKVVDQTRARHILVRVNENTSEADAKARIDRVRDRLDTGAKFEDMARINSDDASAAKGGELGWLSPGDTVPDFERAMTQLQVGEVSQPVRTPFGWHLIRVDERRQQDVSLQRQREQARVQLRQRKADELFAEFVRQTRDRAYVEFKVDER
jgi:peptidyl-prolyl cis-trans isomerase SurA